MIWFAHLFWSFASILEYFVCSSVSRYVGSLVSTALFGRPSAFFDFLHAPILPHHACCSPRHNSRRRSLLMLVLSHSDTHHLNRHMVGCGCHEILIPCSTIDMYRDWRFADKDDSFSPPRTPETLREFYCELCSLVSSSYWYDRTDRSRKKKVKSRSVSVKILTFSIFRPRLTETWPFSPVTGLSGRTNS